MAPVRHPSLWSTPPPSAFSGPTHVLGRTASVFPSLPSYARQPQAGGGGQGGLARRVYVTESTTLSASTTSSSSTASSSSILAEAVATTHLSWWQLLALVLGAVLALGVGVWLWWRHRRKVKADKVKRKEAAAAAAAGGEKGRGDGAGEKGKEYEKSAKEYGKGMKGRRKREESESEGYSDSEWDDDGSGSESDDSMSDGGTIRPSKTRRRRRSRRGRRRRDRGRDRDRDRERRGYGHRRRRSESETETETDWSDEYYSRRYRRRDRDRGYRERGRRRYSYDSYYDRPPPSKRTHPVPHSTATPPVPPIPSGRTEKQSKGFRDSVFSSYSSMKKAAVRLKYVEAKVKLKKQIEEEDNIERKRRERVREANKEIEDEKRRERGTSASELLIPPMKRPSTNHTSSTSSSNLPTPPQRNADNGTMYRGGSLDTIQRAQAQRQGHNKRQLYPTKNEVVDPVRSLPQPRPQRGEADDSLNGEISHLLRNGSTGQIEHPLPPAPAHQHSNVIPRVDTRESPFMAHRPMHATGAGSPPDLPSVPKTARSDSVYLQMTHPRDRPQIPRGKLAPAPPGKQKASSASASDAGDGGMRHGNAGIGAHGARLPGQQVAAPAMGMAGIGSGGGSKWASRLRNRNQ